MARLTALILMPILFIGCANQKLPYIQNLIPQSKTELDAHLAECDGQAEKGLFCVEHPDKAISDHHGILTTFELN